LATMLANIIKRSKTTSGSKAYKNTHTFVQGLYPTHIFHLSLAATSKYKCHSCLQKANSNRNVGKNGEREKILFNYKKFPPVGVRVSRRFFVIIFCFNILLLTFHCFGSANVLYPNAHTHTHTCMYAEQ
jgi:hypothetical protein